ncbi:type III pantothenate kinase [Egibacter rhizosphaerae]|uniref:Type III pantothenate kinase n=1 Tax=Egibacter rhizosphaerae TaxID=1670831 RepID=A0A411YDJ1_9ACTN|nr:type III pantothenate kinase [Egibacter rhizosphaerae]QBI19275.1 type III pantothenate kinase [Egibacter rhizosphaerae]
MLLAVDVGNSQTVIGVFDADRLPHHWRLSTEAQRTSDEWAMLFGGLLRFADLSFRRNVHGLVISSVVPTVTGELRAMADRYFPFRPVVVEPGTRIGIPIKMDNPDEVGADRVVNALAAHHEYGGPGIVVDFGTATSFDVYGEGGEFVGGAIAPGVQSSMDALSARGAQLRTVGLTTPEQAVGRNTVEAMQSGAVYGFAGQVDRIVEELVAELGHAGRGPVVVATGGLAQAVVAACRSIHHHDPWLTLKGLRLVWEHNT